MRQRREWVFVPLLLVGACVAAFAYALHRGREVAQAHVAREDTAVSALRAIAQAQARHHESESRYAWLDDLALTHSVHTDDVGPHVLVDGYRIDALLPAQRQTSPAVEVISKTQGKAHRDLRGKYFVLVARPADPGKTGYRAFYLDEGGLVWINEGVSDEETLRRNPLPRTHLATSEGKDPSGRVWTRQDKLVPRGTHEWQR